MGRGLTRAAAAGAALIFASVLAGCGGASAQNPGEPHASFPVRVTSSFPRSQRLAQTSHMLVRVTNAGHRTIPDVAVSILNPSYGTAAQSFGYLLPKPAAGQPLLASRSRPVWIVMQTPGRCRYSCRDLGPGGAATAYTDTWALGRLAPGQTARFDWTVEAVKAGSWKVQYQVAAGLNGYSKAVTAGSRRFPVTGTYRVKISGRARRARVKLDGQVRYSS